MSDTQPTNWEERAKHAEAVLRDIKHVAGKAAGNIMGFPWYRNSFDTIYDWAASSYITIVSIKHGKVLFNLTLEGVGVNEEAHSDAEEIFKDWFEELVSKADSTKNMPKHLLESAAERANEMWKEKYNDHRRNWWMVVSCDDEVEVTEKEEQKV